MKSSKSMVNDQINFEHWLQEELGYTKKAAKDCVSRCKRIEIELVLMLPDAISSQENFDVLMKDIQIYAQEKTTTKQAAYTLTATLRAAARKYADYKYPQKSGKYKTAHGKGVGVVYWH
jgi:hypothetical protein